MSLDAESTAQRDDWSKGFIEHIRTVHFALVTVSTGLILILSSKTYDPKSAASEMTAVMHQVAHWKQAGVSTLSLQVLSKKPDVPLTTRFNAMVENTHEVFSFAFNGTNL